MAKSTVFPRVQPPAVRGPLGWLYFRLSEIAEIAQPNNQRRYGGKNLGDIAADLFLNYFPDFAVKAKRSSGEEALIAPIAVEADYPHGVERGSKPAWVDGDGAEVVIKRSRQSGRWTYEVVGDAGQDYSPYIMSGEAYVTMPAMLSILRGEKVLPDPLARAVRKVAEAEAEKEEE
ncbi:MAG: hypothetical protein AAB360_01580 [Patescibacteria group bacterium]